MGLKLEVGKYYKTRDGQKVGPLTYHSDEIESYRWQVQGLDLNGTVAAWFDSGAVYITHTSPHDLIVEWTAAPTGPVRTVTRKEIVPGTYAGGVTVVPSTDMSGEGRVSIATALGRATAAELRAAIATLTEIADALEEE